MFMIGDHICDPNKEWAYIQHRSTSSNICEQRLKQRGFASQT